MAVYVRYRPVDVECGAPAANGGVFNFLSTVIVVSLMLTNDPHVTANAETDVMVNMPWLPFLMIPLPANMMTMVMYAPRTERKTYHRANPA